jgi:hypothetical protein
MSVSVCMSARREGEATLRVGEGINGVRDVRKTVCARTCRYLCVYECVHVVSVCMYVYMCVRVCL